MSKVYKVCKDFRVCKVCKVFPIKVFKVIKVYKDFRVSKVYRVLPQGLLFLPKHLHQLL